MGSDTGRLFRVQTFGESHGGAVGAVVDGCPPGIQLDVKSVQSELARRKPGQSSITTQRKEDDVVRILSGVFEGKTLGTPIALMVENRDAQPSAYTETKDRYRPSHADFVYDAKYGHRAWAGGGRASARETVGRVAAGAIARQVLNTLGTVEVVAWVDRVGTLQAEVDTETVSLAQVDANIVRCPDAEAAKAMETRIKEIRAKGDTIGGVVRCVVRGIPAGLGEPVFDKLDAALAGALMSLPACKGVEVGSGFSGTQMTGVAHNDVFIPDGLGGTTTRTNYSGGIQGGISNGAHILLSAAFKPVATVFQTQDTVNVQGEATTIKPRGRHDPCVLPRAVPMVEAMVCLILVDHWLRWRGQVGQPPLHPKV